MVPGLSQAGVSAALGGGGIPTVVKVVVLVFTAHRSPQPQAPPPPPASAGTTTARPHHLSLPVSPCLQQRAALGRPACLLVRLWPCADVGRRRAHGVRRSRVHAAPEQLAGQQRCTLAADIYRWRGWGVQCPFAER